MQSRGGIDEARATFELGGNCAVRRRAGDGCKLHRQRFVVRYEWSSRERRVEFDDDGRGDDNAGDASDNYPYD
jgi:hypothetical protein